jgi:tol-pal system protein YbgF
MESDLQEMKRRLAELERSMAVVKDDPQGRERLDLLTRQQADLQAGLDTLRVDFQSVNGRIEDMSRDRAQIKDDLSLVRDDLALKVTALEDRLARQAEQTKAPAAPAAAAESPEALYERGLELIQKKGDFAGGRQWLQEFLQRYPKHDLAVNAMYWIGEAWYGEKKYENAILQFQDVIQKYGEHPKVAAALLKQGLAFHALGDQKNARVIMQKLIDSFPLSEEAKKARERLTEWKKS